MDFVLQFADVFHFNYLWFSPAEASSSSFSLSVSCFFSSGPISPFVILSMGSSKETHALDQTDRTSLQRQKLPGACDDTCRAPDAPDVNTIFRPFRTPCYTKTSFSHRHCRHFGWNTVRTSELNESMKRDMVVMFWLHSVSTENVNHRDPLTYTGQKRRRRLKAHAFTSRFIFVCGSRYVLLCYQLQKVLLCRDLFSSSIMC